MKTSGKLYNSAYSLFSFLVLAFLSVGCAHPRAEASRETVSFKVNIPQPGENEIPYYYQDLPIRSGGPLLEITYDYDRKKHAIDLGLMAPDGTVLGWSGGKRSTIVISEFYSTPGYQKRKIEPGTWKVILGRYRINGPSAEVVLTAKTDFSFSKPSPPSEKTESRWLKGDLHSHTIHSDGNWTEEALADAAEEEGLDFLVVTEHNTLSRKLQSRPNLKVYTGVELTTMFGHFGVFPLENFTSFFFGDIESLARELEKKEKQGKTVVANHPFAACKWCGIPSSLRETSKTIEIWNSDFSEEDKKAVELLHAHCEKGDFPVVVGGSDTHRFDQKPGYPTTHVFGEVDNVSAAMASGATMVSRGPGVSLPVLSCGQENLLPGKNKPCEKELRLSFSKKFPKKGFVHVFSRGKKEVFSFNKEERILSSLLHEEGDYLRIEIWEEEGKPLLLTSPYFVRL